MIYVTVNHENGDVSPYWLGEEAPISLKAAPEGVSLMFTHEMSGDIIEIGLHPSLVPMLQHWIAAQPKNTFMAKEGKEEMLASMDEADKKWAEAEAGRLATELRRYETPF